jgi:hypothetical protein
MLLTIDIGNTNVTVGLYDGDTLGPRWRLATEHHRMPDEYGILLVNLFEHAGRRPTDVQGIALASVVPPLTGTFVTVCEDYFGRSPFVVDAGVKTGVRIKYDDPKQVGADRVVDAAAVQKLYGGPAWEPPSPLTLFRRRATTWAAPSRPASALPPTRSSSTPPSCPGWTFRCRPPQSDATPCTRSNRACFSAMSAWWKAWWRAFGVSWGHR